MRRLLFLSIFAALPLGAQSVVIEPGMNKATVVAKLGKPAVERTDGEAIYLFYKNGCERTCGMQDVVVFDQGVVVDAVFRSAKRSYSGKSSSPRMIPAAEARKMKATKSEAPADGPITIELKSTKPAAAKPPESR